MGEQMLCSPRAKNIDSLVVKYHSGATDKCYWNVLHTAKDIFSNTEEKKTPP